MFGIRKKSASSSIRSRQRHLRLSSVQQDEMDLATDIRSTIIAQSPRGGRMIVWSLFVFVIIATYWAHNSEIEEITKGRGKVVPSRQIQVVQNLEGGIVSEILVREGQIVNKDQLLLRLDSTRFSGTVKENQIKLLSLKAKLARLEAEAEGSAFKLPEEVKKEIPAIGAKENELFLSRKQELRTGLAILHEKVAQRSQHLKELEAKKSQLSHTYALLEKELTLTAPLVAQGAASEVELLRLQRQASQLRGEITSIELSIPRIESTRKEAESEIHEKTLAFRNRAKSDINQAMSQLETMAVSSITLEDRLQRTMVRSPVHGTINRVLVNTLGGVITPGMDLVEIVPLEDSLLIEARISPSDIGFLSPLQPAMVKFSAYDFTIYGGLEARVEYISADSIADEHGNSFYIARVRTDKNHLGPEDSPLPIIPGMVASVDILTGQKTILSYLLKPILRAKESALRER